MTHSATMQIKTTRKKKKKSRRPYKKLLGSQADFKGIPGEVRNPQAAARAHPPSPSSRGATAPVWGTTLVPHCVLSDAGKGKRVDSVKTRSNIHPPEAEKRNCKYSQVNTWYKRQSDRVHKTGRKLPPKHICEYDQKRNYTFPSPCFPQPLSRNQRIQGENRL